ncbi:PIG-L deacetylase family protein [Cyanobium gracile]|uniref:Putative LmbE-like protein n=1 Tax=Cyanobium gracile (strain ATCC 27147 / PCC 6307) TaxID=292564 RepID=K9P3J9_CYAGP|nr:PIG-L family deacetylase [Cyanobium gracile]AFY27972.1 putative LmbE-like protein [Cyanobium gracile PCC 6307]
MNELSLLADVERHPLVPCEAVAKLGRVVLLAPHPDDEALGCGGLLALLADGNQRAHVIVMTDGCRSHPRSRAYPAARLAALRSEETLAALAVLGYPASAVTFMGFEDGALPADDTAGFGAAACRLRELLIEHSPDTIVLPWRRDSHADHQSTWQLCRGAASGLSVTFRWLEYPVWAWSPPDAHEVPPQATEVRVWLLDIATAQKRKRLAIAQYGSQLGTVVDDDASGFILEPSMLAHFHKPWELYLEPHHG